MKRIFFLGMSICLLILANASAEKIDFETDKGWIAAGSGQGKFEIGVPKVFSTSGGECKTTCLGTGPSGDHSEVGVNAACTNLDGHIAPSETLATNSLTSPVYNFSQKTNVTLELWRFMEIEGNNYDFCYYQYKNSPTGQWVNLETYGAAQIDDNNWVKYSRDLSSIAGGKSYFQLRFYCTTDDWTEGSGLCIDDITITGAESCIPNCQGYTCGMDPVCGTLNCDNPGCTGGDKCEDGSCIPCVPNTCASLGYQCGVHGDGCGGVTPDCGTCVGGGICQNGICRPSSKGIILVQLDDTSPERLDTANLAVEKFHNEGIALTPELWPAGLSNSPSLSTALLWDLWPEIEIAQGVYSGDSCDSSLVADIRKGKLEYAAAGITQPTSYLPHMCYPSSSALDGLRDEGILIVIDYASPNVVRNGDPSDPSQQPLTIDGGRNIASGGVNSYSTVLASVQSQVARKGYADLAFHVWIIDESTLQKIITIMKQLREEGYTFMTATEYYRFLWGGGSSCGNAKLEAGEECDDGNLVNGDGCDLNCKDEVCGNGILQDGEQCDDRNNMDDDGCSSECKIENVQVYFVPYMGDFDGSIDSGWYYFYNLVRQWHDDNNMPGSFSFYPNTMNNFQFNKVIGEMYNTSEVELITKGEAEYNGKEIDLMTYSEVKAVIGTMQNKFVTELTNLNYTNVKAPITYNQKGAEFTNTIRDAVHDLGFKIYLEQYVSEYGYIEQLPDFDITQYSISLTVSGEPGADEVYKKPETVIQELLNFSHPHVIYINGTKVVPLLSHQQDFRISETSDILNQTKWQVYTTVLQNARKDPRIHVLLPEEVYNLRHHAPIYVCGNNKLESGEECDDGNTVSGDGCSSNCKIETFVDLVKVCDWQDCRKGAASVSVDDSYASCRDKLNAHGWKGTYFLMNTKAFSQSTWNLWKSIYNEGHEIGSHTQTHPCSEVSDSTLRSEISSNINDILKNLNMPKKELTSFAWPCGFNTQREKNIAKEYFISARGYHINELEDKNPLDFMEIKSLNTPHYHNPPYTPPDYFDMADLAESSGKWVNFVFHDECDDDGAIDYLASKKLWVAPVGKVAKYIIERQRANIVNLQNTSSTIKFDLVDSLNHTLFNQELTIKVFMGEKTAKILKINGIDKTFNSFTENGKKYIKFNILPTGNDKIEITLETEFICGNGILEAGEECDTIYGCKSSNCSKTYFDYCNGSRLVEYDDDKGLDNTTVTNYCENECNNCICTKCSADCPTPNTNMYCVKDVCGAQCVQDADCGSDYKCDLNKCGCVLINEPYCGDGIKNGNEECDDGNLVGGDGCSGDCRIEKSSICQYASSASATSENSGSLAKYAVGKPNAPKAGCNGWNEWSGYGYTWGPQNWKIKANLTLFYNEAVYATNFTIYGDYDMCWDRMWLRNNATAQQNLVFSGYDKNCISTHKLNGDFLANTIILETCGWSWSSTDAVELCGDI